MLTSEMNDLLVNSSTLTLDGTQSENQETQKRKSVDTDRSIKTIRDVGSLELN